MKMAMLTFWIFIFLSIGAQTSHACSCNGTSIRMKIQMMEGKVDSLYKDWLNGYSGVVFTGQVTNIKKVRVITYGQRWHNYRVTFNVNRYWKGVDSSKIVVFTGIGGGDCGIRFRKDESYIVFAQISENRLTTGICNFTAQSRYAQNIIKVLDLGEGKEIVK